MLPLFKVLSFCYFCNNIQILFYVKRTTACSINHTWQYNSVHRFRKKNLSASFCWWHMSKQPNNFNDLPLCPAQMLDNAGLDTLKRFFLIGVDVAEPLSWRNNDKSKLHHKVKYSIIKCKTFKTSKSTGRFCSAGHTSPNAIKTTITLTTSTSSLFFIQCAMFGP